jgi:hypothetical protein
MSDAKNNEGKHVISQQTYEYLAFFKMPMGLYQHKYKHSEVFFRAFCHVEFILMQRTSHVQNQFLQFAPPVVIIEKTLYHLVSSI